MMIGLPNDTLHTIEQSFSFGDKLQKKYGAGVLYSITTPYPGTYIFNHQQKLGITITTKRSKD